MRIKTKLLWGLSTKPILILVLIISGWLQVANLKELSSETQTKYELSLLAEQIQREVKNTAISLRNLIIFTDQDAVQKELTNIQEQSDHVTRDITLFEDKATTTDQKQMLQELKQTNDKFNEYKQQIIDYIGAGQRQPAIALVNRDSHNIHDEFLQVISKITENLEADMSTSFNNVTNDTEKQIWLSSLTSLLLVLISVVFISSVVLKLAARLGKVSKVMTNVANGTADLRTKVEVISDDEIDDVARSFNRMVDSLEEKINQEQDMLWMKSNSADISTSLSGARNVETLASTFLSKMAPLLESSHAVFYVIDKDAETNELVYKLAASYALDQGKLHPDSFAVGEGLIGQAALEKSPIILTDVPIDYIRVKSGLGQAVPSTLYVLPIMFEGSVKAVVELASFKSLTVRQQALLDESINGLGIILESVLGRIQLAKLLEESQQLMEEIQAQSEELQAQQEELRVTNEELEEQTQALRQSEQILQVQQEELEQTNADLKEKAEILVEQNKMFEMTNKEVEKARAELEEKAKQLALNSKYKSEFLANMSHELRTPLNSLLILSKLLADNLEGNLSEKQVKYSKTIYSSGSDLLILINDILDLAKVESGKLEVLPSKVMISDLTEFIESSFKPIASEKNLSFNIVLHPSLPLSIYSDEKRLQQILKNLLSNAFKFTHEGGVTLEIGVTSPSSESPTLSFSIIDTGIGIPSEKQELIFQAFQQADGTTSRRYGGTGLGLSICRELANLLKAEIIVESAEGKGSRFTLLVDDYVEDEETEGPIVSHNEVAVSKEIIQNEAIVNREQITLPVEVNPATLVPVNKEIKRLLIVDDDQNQRNSLMELIGDKDVVIKAVSTGTEAMEELKVNRFDFMILDLGLTDFHRFELLEKIKFYIENDGLIVFIYTGRELTTKEEIYLKKYAQAVIIKDEKSPQRLEDELDLYLNPSGSSKEQTGLLEMSQPKAYSGLEGKRILLVDDDVRNVYALMSLLELYHMEISFAENGRESIEVLENSPSFDLVLMDIMMPEMDGYEAIRRIRKIPAFTSLPIIALTAKAMKEDRQKCIEAGASDYIVKPFDTDQLISLIKVWLYKK